MKTNKLAAIALIPTLGVAALVGSVFAAGEVTTATTNTTSTTSSTYPIFGGRGGNKGLKDSTMMSKDLASILGLTEADIKAKLDAGTSIDDIIAASGKSKDTVMTELDTLRQANMKTQLTADVLSGKITQAQADEMITNMANHTGGMRGNHGPRDNTAISADLASILGLNVTDVKAKLDAGSKPDEIITAAGKTVTDVMTQLGALRQANMKTRLAADVASGKITQAQADEMITNMANHTGVHGPRTGSTTTTTSTQ